MSKPITKCTNSKLIYNDTDSVKRLRKCIINEFYGKAVNLESGSIYSGPSRVSHIPTNTNSFKAPLQPFKENHIGGFINMDINVHVHTKGCEPKELTCGDWIDLKTAEEYTLKKGDFQLLSLGISMSLPDHMEAHLIVRSSTFMKYGIIQTNGIGIIDNSYNGDADIWRLPALATRDVTIPKGARIAQFRIIANQPTVRMNFVPSLSNESRGGFGSTGD